MLDDLSLQVQLEAILCRLSEYGYIVSSDKNRAIARNLRRRGFIVHKLKIPQKYMVIVYGLKGPDVPHESLMTEDPHAVLRSVSVLLDGAK